MRFSVRWASALVSSTTGPNPLTQSYSVESDHEGDKKDEALAWQLEFIALFADEAEHYSETFHVAYYAERSIDDALAGSVTGEISLFVATCKDPTVSVLHSP